MFVCAKKNVALGDAWRSVHGFPTDRVGREAFKFRTGAEDEDISVLVRGVKAVTAKDWRGPGGLVRARAGESFLPDGFSGDKVAALGEAAHRNLINVALVNHAGADARLAAGREFKPEAMGSGHVSAAARTDSHARDAKAAAGERGNAIPDKRRAVSANIRPIADPEPFARPGCKPEQMKRQRGNEFIATCKLKDYGSGPRAIHFRNLEGPLAGLVVEVFPLHLRAEGWNIIPPDRFACFVV